MTHHHVGHDLHRSRAGVVVLVFLSSLVGLLLPAAPASAATGVVSGTVVSSTGAPLRHIRVEGYWNYGTTEYSNWGLAFSSDLDEPGRYRINAAPGTYRLRFVDNENAYAAEYYDNATTLDTATAVTVTSGGTTVADAALTERGSISGTVTAEDTGLPLANLDVSAYQNLGTASHPEWESYDTYTDADGRYRLNTGAGAFVLWFEEDYDGH